MKVYIYCTKAKPYLLKQAPRDMFGNKIQNIYQILESAPAVPFSILNGKIVASFELNEIEKIIEQHWINQNTYTYHIKYHRGNDELLRNSCLTLKELNDYLGMNNGYAWHIENLTPTVLLKLKEFYIFRKSYEYQLHMNKKTLTKAPQSFQYAYYRGERCIILSVKAKWVEKILNGKKTIEVRKTAPKEMMK